MTSERVVLHADMDAFYASIEQRDDPSLRGKPVIVGATSARGVVSAASYEARVFGVRSAMPGFEARRLCPHGVFLPGNMEKYARVSDEVHAVFERFSPDVEPIALDEAFLDVTGSLSLFGGPLALGRRLKQEVRDAVGLTVSVGMGPGKLVAKIACTLGKPDGFLYVPSGAVTWLLHPLAVRRIWGVGPVLEETLRSHGIRTILDLHRFDARALERIVGDRAESLKRLAAGEDDREVEAHLAPKSCGEENTFEQDVSARDVVTAALTAHAEAVARRLRRDGLRGRTVTLKVKLARRRGVRASRTSSDAEPIYPQLTRSRTLPTPTADGAIIRDVAIALWDAAAIAEPVRLLGVTLSGLGHAGAGGESAPDGGGRSGEPHVGEQLDLFASVTPQARGPQAPGPSPEPPRGERLGAALDAITEKFGKGAIGRAVAAPGKITHSDRRKRGE